MKKPLSRAWFTVRSGLWRVAEAAGFGLLVLAVWMVHPIAGLVAAGLALLNYAYGGKRRQK